MKIQLLTLALLGILSAQAQERQEILLQEDWQFSRDKQTWQTVSVPHDWAISGPFDKKWDLQTVAIVQNGEKNATVEYLLTLVGSNYKLNLELANNKIAVAEKSNFKGTIDQIKFKGETLLAIEKGKIVKTFEGNEEIIKYLESIKK